MNQKKKKYEGVIQTLAEDGEKSSYSLLNSQSPHFLHHSLYILLIPGEVIDSEEILLWQRMNALKKKKSK
jgi:Fe2+ or Zn2+ uptake regulation protein